MSAYRGGHGRAPVEAGREDGLVDELIAQFADPLAFFRELVQNSIDAGATSIAVAIGWTPDHESSEGEDPTGTIEIAVRDDGCGMGREVLEEQLTVLFRSGKEGQKDKIGKFGVGFVSVLALAPEVVVVRTSEGDGAQWTLELRSDQTFELFRAEGGGSSGTTVTLRVPRRRGEVDALVEGSERALVKWCRHAAIPIKLVATLPGGEIVREARIDRPLGLDGYAAVSLTRGPTKVVAALPKDGTPYLAFFNQGLLLHETTEEVLGRVMVSIQDPRLEHTLSRDNVRRDEHHRRALKHARVAIDEHLTRRVHDLLAELGRRERTEPPIESLLSAAWNASLDLDRRRIRVPLLEPLGRDATISLADLKRRDAWVASQRDALTAAMAEAGHAILDVSVSRHPMAYQQAIAVLTGGAFVHAHQAFTLAAPVETSGADLRLLERVGELVGELARRPKGPKLARLLGARAGALSLSAAGGDLPLALDEEEASVDPFRLLGRPTWLIGADHVVVEAARALAVTDVEAAAALLARALLIDLGRLGPEVEDEWLERASEAR